MTNWPKRDNSEESRSRSQLPNRGITDADVQRIAAAGEIPEEQLPKLKSKLTHAVDRYLEAAPIYAKGLTKKQKLESIGEISADARKLSALLKQHWIYSYMIGYEVLKSPFQEEETFFNCSQSAEIEEQVKRELSGVEALTNRSAAMLNHLELRPENEDEKIAAIPRAKPAIKNLHKWMRTYWMGLERTPTFAEESPFVKVARAVYGVVGLDEQTSFETIRSRHKAAAR